MPSVGRAGAPARTWVGVDVKEDMGDPETLLNKNTSLPVIAHRGGGGGVTAAIARLSGVQASALTARIGRATLIHSRFVIFSTSSTAARNMSAAE